MSAFTIAFVGAGQMAASLIGGLCAKGFPPTHISASDPSAERRTALVDTYNISAYTTNAEAIQAADVVVLAVKPQVMRAVCTELKGTLKPKQLCLSIAAGVSCQDLSRWLENPTIIRCMPNTPALIGLGMSALFAAPKVGVLQKEHAQKILEAVGQVLWLDAETELDAVTAVSGSGPAYFFLLIEAMTAAGVALGLSQQTAAYLSIQTALGAGSMAAQSTLSAEQLRKQVTSPNGTTQAAIAALQAGGFETLVKKALTTAAERSKQLTIELGA